MQTTFEYDVFKSSLQELSDEITFDEGDGDWVFEGGNQNRTGIFFRGNHICNVDRGFVTEFEKVEEFCEPNEIRISPQENNQTDESITCHQDLFHTKGDVFEQECFKDLNLKLGKQYTGQVKFGTSRDGQSDQAIARRMEVGYKDKVTGEIEAIDGIMVYIYLKEVMIKTTIERIGWRSVFDQLLALNIDGITKETIESKFDVDITSIQTSDGPSVEKEAAEVLKKYV